MNAERMALLLRAEPDAEVRNGGPDLSGYRSVAVFSWCTRYRYALAREWDAGKGKLVVIGLNPSTADESTDDPTVTRCIRRAISLGCGGLVMLNLFAFRATDPAVMKVAADPIGAGNDVALRVLCADRPVVLAAWGNHGVFMNRAEQVARTLTAAGVTLHSLRITSQGQPQHPLYVSYSQQPAVWRTGARVL